MPTVVSTPPKKTAKRPAGSDWDELSIRHAEGGGFIITKRHDWGPGASSKQQKDPLPYPATEPGTALDYLESCLGKREHAAHEEKEEKGEKSEKKGY